MKKFTVIFILAVNFLTSAIQAQTGCSKQTVEQLAGELAKAYKARALGRLDAKRPFLSRVGVRIENSLAADDDADRFESKRFKNLKSAEKWLQDNETNSDGMFFPARQTEPLISCKKGVCKYNVQGLLHNQLFLQRFSFGYKKNGCPYIKTIYLIDGN